MVTSLGKMLLQPVLAQISPPLDAAHCLAAAGLAADVLEALSAVPKALPLFADFFITRSPHLTSKEWAAAWSAVPAPCSGMMRALPAVLAHSTEQAGHLPQHPSKSRVACSFRLPLCGGSWLCWTVDLACLLLCVSCALVLNKWSF
jgi:hypothetical protein